jgi:Leucine-rich repeat (LRR) protein/GTPase SAR1 family protein
MTELAQKLIEKEREIRSGYLDLGRCGLREMPDLSNLDWLETLILSNEWWDWEQEGFVQSPNKGGLNLLSSPRAENFPKNLKNLVLGGGIRKNWEIRETRFLSNLTDLTTLDLRSNQISDVSFLSSLSGLTTLNLNNNQISDVSFLSPLSGLSRLDLSYNQISDVSFLSSLSGLTTLDLTYNQISEVSFLSSLSGLTTLYLGSNQISDVSFLSSLSGLSKLSLRANQISDVSFLSSLSGLLTLQLSTNQISDVSFLSSLSGLSTLNLSSNQISDVSFLSSLSGLSTLNLSFNQISDVSSLSLLSGLTTLNLSSNQISDVSFLSSLSGLTTLSLRSNQINDVSFLLKLSDLNPIDISDNLISDLSPLQYFFQEKGMQVVWKEWYKTGEGEINVTDNPLTNPPVEVVQDGNEAILRYFEEKERLEKIGQPVYIKVREAKVLIVGQGKSGKTSLRVKLENPEAAMPASGDTTRGIEITQLEARMPHSSDPLRLNLWDFGGQNVQHFAHQLFLTGNALYVLVTNERIQDQVHLPYWLNIIDMLGKKSPILLVQNMDGGHCEPLKNEASIQATFSNVQKPVFQTDISKAYTETSFSQLRKKIIETSAVLPHIEKNYLSSFHHLREKIEAKAAQLEHYLKWAEYLQLMPELSEDLMRDYANSLTFLGVCQYFPDDLTLRNYVFLRPKWLIDALFDLILHPSLENSRGHFSENDTLQIWKGKDYTGMHNLLLRIMEEFELCYRVQGEGRDYIVPQRLPGENQTYGWPYEGDTPVQFQYKFLPKGILTRLICRLHPRIEKQADLGQRVWCDAVIFTLPDGKGRVFAREVYAQNTIELRATGEKRAEILNQVIQTLDDIHTDPKTRFENLVVEKMVPCPCEECQQKEESERHSFKFSVLEKALLKGISELRCDRSLENVQVDEIFGKSGVKKPESRRNWRDSVSPIFTDTIERPQMSIPLAFFSYSKHDTEYLTEFRKHLGTLERNNKIRLWDDRDIRPGEEWDDAIKQNLAESSIIFLLVSVDFLNTEYVWETEITEAMSRHEKGEATVIPIKIRECDWSGTPFSKLQGLPRKDTIIGENPKNDAVWTEVVKEIGKMI